MKKLNRVRKSREFQKLIHTGRKKAGESFVFYYAPKAEEEARIGITLPGKIGHAVDRNRIKRQTRMMCEELVDFKTYPFDVILIVRFRYKELSYADNKKSLETVSMKRNPTMRKLLLLGCVVFAAVLLTGCAIPTDPETHEIIQITPTTTFSEIMSSESWFSAILVWPMAQFLNKLTPVLGVAGAIALLTIIVNGILMIFTLKSTIATQQMQLLQPEMEKIQRKYEGKDDDASKMKQAQEMQNLYKKYNVNPFSMILITFLQFPIIISVYQAVQRATAVRTGTFLGLPLDQTIMNGLRNGQWGYLIIFIFMGVCQFLSMQLPQWIAKKKAEELAAKQHRKPDVPQNQQSKMMQYYMLVMILVFGLMWPAAMSVYWAIYSIVTIVKTLLVQKIIDNRKEGAK